MKIESVKTEHVKMMYLIKRRVGVTREELLVNWFANHMPDVIAGQQAAAARGQAHASRYIATVYDPPRGMDAEEQAWDGVAQLWWDEAPPAPSVPHGTKPRDTFQQKAEPYVPWATTEHLVLDGEVPFIANDLNDPFPCTRTGFVKVTALIVIKPDVDHEQFFEFWLGTHAANVASTLEQVGGQRYVINLGGDSVQDRYTGMAELYFPDRAAFARYREIFQSDGIDDWVDRERGHHFVSNTEMVGIA